MNPMRSHFKLNEFSDAYLEIVRRKR